MANPIKFGSHPGTCYAYQVNGNLSEEKILQIGENRAPQRDTAKIAETIGESSVKRKSKEAKVKVTFCCLYSSNDVNPC